MVEDVEAFGVRGHHRVLDAVVHHLHEVARADRTTIQEPVFLITQLAAGAGRAGRSVDARCERR